MCHKREHFDGYGRPYQTTDNAGHITRTFYDSSGRTEYVVENCAADFLLTNGNFGNCTSRATEYAYNDAGQMIAQIAHDGDRLQTTT